LPADVLETEIKTLIVEALMLDDVRPEEIDAEGPLFGDGLGLDSIDALELAMAIDRRYSVRINADDEEVKRIYSSVRSLARYVAEHRPATEKGER
jgi:acyl carrier protein